MDVGIYRANMPQVRFPRPRVTPHSTYCKETLDHEEGNDTRGCEHLLEETHSLRYSSTVIDAALSGFHLSVFLEKMGDTVLCPI